MVSAKENDAIKDLTLKIRYLTNEFNQLKQNFHEMNLQLSNFSNAHLNMHTKEIRNMKLELAEKKIKANLESNTPKVVVKKPKLKEKKKNGNTRKTKRKTSVTSNDKV